MHHFFKHRISHSRHFVNYTQRAFFDFGLIFHFWLNKTINHNNPNINIIFKIIDSTESCSNFSLSDFFLNISHFQNSCLWNFFLSKILKGSNNTTFLLTASRRATWCPIHLSLHNNFLGSRRILIYMFPSLGLERWARKLGTLISQQLQNNKF